MHRPDDQITEISRFNELGCVYGIIRQIYLILELIINLVCVKVMVRVYMVDDAM